MAATPTRPPIALFLVAAPVNIVEEVVLTAGGVVAAGVVASPVPTATGAVDAELVATAGLVVLRYAGALTVGIALV